MQITRLIRPLISFSFTVNHKIPMQMLDSVHPVLHHVSPVCSSLHHPPSFPHPLFPSTSPSSSQSVACPPFISQCLCPLLSPFQLFFAPFLIVVFPCHTLTSAPPGTLSCVTSHHALESNTQISSSDTHSWLPEGNLIIFLCNEGFYTNRVWKELSRQSHRHQALRLFPVHSAQSCIHTRWEDARRGFMRGDKDTHGWLLAGIKWNTLRQLDWLVRGDISELREAVWAAEW